MIRKITLLTATLAVTQLLTAQSLSITSSDSYVKGFVDENPMDGHVYLENTSGNDGSFLVQRNIITEVKNALNNFCWGPTCYPDFISLSPNANLIQSAEIDSSFKGDYVAFGNPGVVVVNYLFFNEQDNTDSISHTITYEAIALPKVWGSLTYCSGDMTILDAGPNYDSYLWSTGATTQTITVTAGTYHCEVMIASETRYSDTVTVTQTNGYSPQISGALEYCENETTVLDAGSGYAGYLWSDNNQTTQTITVAQGTYTVTVSSINGCTGTATVTVSENAYPGTPDLTWDGTWLETTATGDYIKWYKDGFILYGEHGQTYEPEENGDYKVVICDTSACCCTESSITVLSNVSIAEVGETPSTLIVYPNPANSLVNFESEKSIISTSLYNATGKQIFSKGFQNTRVSINIENMPTGIYLYEIVLEDGGTKRGKLMVSH